MGKKNNYIWLASIPEIGGIGISVISDTEESAKKILKKEFYAIKRDWWKGQEYNTYKGALEYFGGTIKKVYFNKVYDDQLR